MSRLSPPTRIAICLAFLSVNVLLCAQIFGLIPNGSAKDEAPIASLQTVSSQLTGLTNQIEDPNGAKTRATIQEAVAKLVKTQSDVVGIKVVRADGKLVASSGNVKEPQGQHVVPLVVGEEPWGQATVTLVSKPATAQSIAVATLTHPLVVLTVFVAVMTFLFSLAYVHTAFWRMDPTMVVPDHVRNALDSLAEGLLLLDNSMEIAYANKAFTETMQMDPGRLMGLSIEKLPWVPVNGEKLGAFPWETPNEEGQSEGVLGLHDHNGQLRTFLVRTSMVLDQDESQRGMMVSFDDMTALERKKAELGEMLTTLKKLKQTGEETRRRTEELEILVTQDPLTSCLNRRSFFSEYETQWRAAERYGHPLSFIMVDIDNFKSINDELGHSTGDSVIRDVAQTLRDSVRDFDIVCRYGGEEFCILLPHVDVVGAVQAAERCRQYIESQRLDDGRPVTASMGVSSRDLGCSNTQDMVEQADRALYSAKRGGRNRVVCWTEVPEDVKHGNSVATRRATSGEQLDVPIPFHAVAALISALHFRDPETADHCRRVADLCVATAAGKMSESERYMLEIAALLHDIGKLGVPEAILMKEAPLTDEEWRLMRTHALIGIEIINTSLGSQRLTEIVSAHHAWYGGRDGDRLVGEDIPMCARILSIADAFDSMVSDRPYRQGMSRVDAFSELRRCTQSQFDPELVEDFIRTVQDQDATRRDPLDHVSKRAALNIGLQMEKLVCALDAEDTITLCQMASQLRGTANDTGIPEIAKVATQLETAVSYDPDWNHVSALTNELLDVCRSTQHSYLNAVEDVTSAG